MATESNGPMPMSGTLAVLLSCHGTVDRSEDVPAFLQNIRRGRPASAAVIAEVQRRFVAIGGSPLLHISRAQAKALEQRLGVPVRVAGRLWHPYPAEVVGDLAAAGVRRLVSLPLAPQSVHVYHPPVEAAAAAQGMEVRRAPSWGLEPALVGAFAEAVGETLGRLPETERREAAVLLTAHSLPRPVLAAGDPYEADFRAMAAAVAARLGAYGVAADAIGVAFQSQGLDGGDWLGPDLQGAMAEVAARGRSALLVAPIGFVAEHVETLWDLDVEAAGWARELGFLRFERMPALNTRPAFIDALEAVARRLLP
jgi:ferrochelatase